MFRKPLLIVLFVLGFLLLTGSLLAASSPEDTEPEVTLNYATTITVTSGLDVSTGGGGIVAGQPVTLRQAINSALGATKPVLINFDIPESCDSYDSDLDIWKIELLGVGTGAPTNTTFRALNGDITIDGTTQNGRENGPQLFLMAMDLPEMSIAWF